MKKVDDFKCPKCKTWGVDGEHESTIVEKTKPIFTGDYAQFDNEPGLLWIEIHHCKCGTLYCFENGA